MIAQAHHLIWLTGSSLPRREFAWAQTWCVQNPTWTTKIWTLYDIWKAKIPQECRECLCDPILHWVLKTDIARFLVLWLDGGVYSDTDVECCKPLSPFLAMSSFAGFSCTPQIVGNAVIGAEPANPIMLDCAMRITEKIRASGSEAANADICDHGVNHAGKLLSRVELLLPAHYFYPFGSGEAVIHKPEEFPESYCLHHWTGSMPGGWAKKGRLKA